MELIDHLSSHVLRLCIPTRKLHALVVKETKNLDSSLLKLSLRLSATYSLTAIFPFLVREHIMHI